MLVTSDLSQMEIKLYELTKEVLETTDLELYDCEYIKGSKTLRVYVCEKDTRNAVIEDCVLVDRAFTPFVEEANWIPNDFVLEVSSPGVYRNLKTKEHFEESVGEFIQVKFKPGTASNYLNKKILRGSLKEFNENILILDLGGDPLEIDFKDISKANLDPDIV